MDLYTAGGYYPSSGVVQAEIAAAK